MQVKNLRYPWKAHGPDLGRNQNISHGDTGTEKGCFVRFLLPSCWLDPTTQLCTYGFARDYALSDTEKAVLDAPWPAICGFAPQQVPVRKWT